MNGFDDLLYRVLQEDCNQQLPPGMKERVLSVLAHENNQFPNQSAMWIGLAAAMLIGLFGIATWTQLRTNRGPMVTTNSAQSLLEQSATPQELGEAARTHLHLSAEKPGARKSILHGSVRNQSSLQRQSIQITPLVIQPLVINPIEIASITPRGAAMKGKLR
jgi:hypothetical protein